MQTILQQLRSLNNWAYYTVDLYVYNASAIVENIKNVRPHSFTPLLGQDLTEFVGLLEFIIFQMEHMLDTGLFIPEALIRNLKTAIINTESMHGTIRNIPAEWIYDPVVKPTKGGSKQEPIGHTRGLNPALAWLIKT